MKQTCRVIALGEVLWDVFDDSTRLGGAPLNFAAHASRMGHDVLLISGVGDDQLGRSALGAIGAIGLDTRLIRTVQNIPTGAARVLRGPDGQTSFRIERPAAYDAVELSPDCLADLCAWNPRWLYFGTLFAHYERARATLDAVAAAVPEASRFYDVNLRPDCYSPETVLELLRLADVVKLNETEMQAVAQFAGLPRIGTEAFCREGAARYGWAAVAVTLGPNGCAIWTGGEYAEAPGYSVSVVDTVGAGDGFGAAMLHGLSLQWPARDIGDFANQVGALIASRPGGIPDWKIDEVRIPDGPAGTNPLPHGDAASSAVSESVPHMAGVFNPLAGFRLALRKSTERERS
jgi:fructokinase